MFAYDSDSDYDELDHCLDAAQLESDDLYSIVNLVRGQPPRKKAKIKDLKPIVYVRFNSRMGKAKPVTLRCLLDTGASGTLIAQRHAKKLRMKKLGGVKTIWTTPAGELNTGTKCQGSFIIPEFHHDRVIEWDLHVTKTLGAYDMILGRDILADLGFKFDFTTMSVEWDGISIPMKDSDSTMEENFHIPDPELLEESAERLKKILDAKYVPADLRKVCEEQLQLNKEEQDMLYALLNKYSDLFDGTLGKWRMDDYHVELRPMRSHIMRKHILSREYISTH